MKDTRTIRTLLPSLLAVALLQSCGSVVHQQRILDGRARMPPAPPLPMLVEGGSGDLSASLAAGVSRRIGSRLSPNAFDDSVARPIELGGGIGSLGGVGAFRLSIFRVGGELTQERSTLTAGFEISGSAAALALYTGGGWESFSDRLLLRQNVVDMPSVASTRVYDTIVDVSASGWQSIRTWGGAFELGPRWGRAFFAVRHIDGPSLDGTRSSGTDVPAVNALDLSRNLFDFGIRVRPTAQSGLIAGAGWQVFSDSRLPGSEFHAFAGFELRVGSSEKDESRR